MPEFFVKSFTHLKDRPKPERALALLQRVASLAKPIMKKHGWVLPVLAEFFPDSPNLLGLNINGGEKILLRLRPPSAPDTFYEEEQVVRVMLHELTHNVHSAHDEKFYKYLSELEEEYDALRQSGYAGEGFHGPGHRLGANVSHNLPPHMARLKALEAAEKRRKIGALMGGERRLGGTGLGTKGLTPRELAAKAAERRANDEKACASGATAQREAEKAARESVEDNVIDLTGEGDDSDEDMMIEQPSAGPSKSHDSPAASVPETSARNLSNRTEVAPASGNLNKSSSPSKWVCATCTLINSSLALQCDACLSNRPVESSEWICPFCGESGMRPDCWTCQFCGSVLSDIK